MTGERVIVTRTEIGQLHEKATEMLAIINAILQRPEPTPVEKTEGGWPVLGRDPEEQP
ncbi:hypothetical protein AB0E63_06285 [Kribbella sp. NPDC026596]|uniref:hypothetical protein n=1 Tax=Kribbella sp. NPDC026596 TaxID=3155122 RepID=UPI0033CA5D69